MISTSIRLNVYKKPVDNYVKDPSGQDAKIIVSLKTTVKDRCTQLCHGIKLHMSGQNIKLIVFQGGTQNNLAVVKAEVEFIRKSFRSADGELEIIEFAPVKLFLQETIELGRLKGMAKRCRRSVCYAQRKRR